MIELVHLTHNFSGYKPPVCLWGLFCSSDRPKRFMVRKGGITRSAVSLPAIALVVLPSAYPAVLPTIPIWRSTGLESLASSESPGMGTSTFSSS